MKLIFEVETTEAFWDPPERGLEIIRNAIDAAAPESYGRRGWSVVAASYSYGDPAKQMLKAFQDKLYNDMAAETARYNRSLDKGEDA